MFHEKDASIVGEPACFNSLRSAEKRGQGGNRKQNRANHKSFPVCLRGTGLEICSGTSV